MIDAAAYRANETNAKRAIASWRLSNINDPYVFQNQGFPVRADSFLDLAQILDTMQEGRFDYYMKEIGGFTEDDTNFFVKICLDYIDFYCTFFQRERVVVPLSTLISHFVIYKKLLGYKPRFERLLEIGPGCGYLSFFLRDHKPLRDYTQIESTESFYLLQSHINAHIFGPRFAEHAVSRRAPGDHDAYVPKLDWHNQFHYEEQNIVSVETQAICNHYPWWRIGEVAQRQYDIVTTNANLNEFSREALFQYLSLIRDVLTDDGVIIAQCLGGGPPTYDTIFANMKSAGFVPAALIRGTDDPRRVFPVSNAVFVGEKHPLYEQFADKPPLFPMIDRSMSFVNQMYFLNDDQPERKRILAIREVLDAIIERIERSESGEKAPEGILSSPGLRNANVVRKATQLANPAAAQDPSAPESDMERDRRRLAYRTEAERKRLASEIDVLKRALEDVLHSTSWKVGAPVRVAGRLVKRLRG